MPTATTMTPAAIHALHPDFAMIMPKMNGIRMRRTGTLDRSEVDAIVSNCS